MDGILFARRLVGIARGGLTKAPGEPITITELERRMQLLEEFLKEDLTEEQRNLVEEQLAFERTILRRLQ